MFGRTGKASAHVIVAVTLASCGSNDDGGSAQAGLVERMQQKMVECGLVSDSGKWNAYDPTAEDYDIACEYECIASLECDVVKSYCIEPSAQVDDCWYDCIGVFECADGTTVSKEDECNGIPDCADGSDEESCPESKPFCADGREPALDAWRCDGVPDCEDESDEADCPRPFACADGVTTVPGYAECDLFAHCPDGSDEHEGCAKSTCSGFDGF